MSDSKVRVCAVCRQSYRYCPRCIEDKDKPAFMFTFCSSNCRDIYDITSKYENGQITDIVANKKLKDLDLSKIENFGSSYKNSINKIMDTNIDVVEDKIHAAEDLKEETYEQRIDSLEGGFPITEEIVEDKSIKKPRGRKAKGIEE